MSKYWDIIKNAAGETTGVILIYGEIGGIDWDSWQEINTAAKFKAEFSELEKNHSTIEVRINSVGGSVFEGLAIATAIQQSKSEVHTYIDGTAYSMASIIAMSGHKVFMAKNSLLMIHKASLFAWGNAADLRKIADDLEKHDQAMSTIIEDRTGKTQEQVFSDYLDGEDHFFTSDEALEAGFVDEVLAKPVPESAVAKNINSQSPKGYNKIAASLLKFPRGNKSEKEWRAAVLGSSVDPKQSETKTEKMNFENLKAALESGKLDNVFSPENIASIKEEISAALKEGDVITKSDFQKVENSLKDATAIVQGVSKELELAEGEEVLAKVKELKQSESEAQAKLSELAPPAEHKETPDPVITSKTKIDDLPHNKAFDQAKQGREIW